MLSIFGELNNLIMESESIDIILHISKAWVAENDILPAFVQIRFRSFDNYFEVTLRLHI